MSTTAGGAGGGLPLRPFALALLLQLPACATLPPPALPAAEAQQVFSLQGRLSVRQGDQSFSTKLTWQAGVATDEILVTTPLGQGLARIRRDERGVSLVRPGEAVLTAESVEALTQAALGFCLPLSGLRHWIQARPDPARPSEIRHDAAGEVTQITQDGWKIDYLQFQESRPRKMQLRRDDLEIRLVIDAWQTN